MVTQHVAGDGVPSIEEANLAEQMLLPPSACRPRMRFGCSLDEALSSSSSGGSSSQAQPLQRLVELYAGERYLLTWRDGTAHVLLQATAAPLDLLRAMWQAAWLERHYGDGTSPAAAGAGTAAGGGNGAAPPVQHAGAADMHQLEASLAALQQQWPDFAAAAAAQGWQLEKAVLPRGRTLVRLE